MCDELFIPGFSRGCVQPRLVPLDVPARPPHPAGPRQPGGNEGHRRHRPGRGQDQEGGPGQEEVLLPRRAPTEAPR